MIQRASDTFRSTVLEPAATPVAAMRKGILPIDARS